MNNISYVIDGILVFILIFCAFRAYKDGFFTSIVNLVGNLAGLVLSWFAAQRYSVVVYQALFRQKLVEQAFSYLQSASDTVDIQSMLSSFLAGFPQGVVDKLIGPALNDAQTALEPTIEVATYLVDNFLGPVIISILSVMIFVICLTLVKIIIRFLAKAFKIVNKVPVLGFANRMAGFMVGIVTGAINIILLSCLLSIITIITSNSLSFLNNDILMQSKILAMTSGINPFLI